MAEKYSKLGRMSMPAKKKPLDDVTIVELEMEPADVESGDDSDAANELAGESTGETDGPLADASDDDLLAEVRKRGLTAAAEKAASDEPLSDSEY